MEKLVSLKAGFLNLDNVFGLYSETATAAAGQVSVLGDLGAVVAAAPYSFNGDAWLANNTTKTTVNSNTTFTVEAQQACAETVELYNTRCLHWALGFKTPAAVHRTA
ncbi:MAG: hypothetical protein LBF90_01400 [Prevotellaceae bacterium]|jgi:hypothetical protein|nr:hypothetical protein [Prevotellaceae bacterium]